MELDAHACTRMSMVSIKDQLTSNKATHSIRSPFFTCWPSLGLSLAPHISLSITTLTNHNAALLNTCLEPIYSLHPRHFSPVTSITPSVSLLPVVLCSPTPLSPRYLYYALNTISRQSCPIVHRHM